MLSSIERARRFAVKFNADAPRLMPTDETMADTFRNCTRPPKPEMYDEIRNQVMELRVEHNEYCGCDIYEGAS
ncbi:hypothetical protein GCM10012275_28790 [Longimycelium tulufanense]|uniref:Uncharacterized protein n=1 Tax=Longimycelium tulufanense TaxID=907463 RepID=A0A8J3FU64_9PSEU|nr:hypothetical protein [Longimycelium tulufanense]GGM55907.1 hypothetical protein GCM10012275_28790 [Longimycelium tulufanense]